MEISNHTVITDFILVGFSQNLQTCILHFLMFFIIYILIIFGNGFLIFIVIINPKLHTPMYYFLCNLSFIDLCYSTCTLPKLLIDIFSRTRRISVIGCLIQMNLTLYLVGTECILLAVMAYDRYIAICFPLYYTVFMSWRVCRYITVTMWVGSLSLTMIATMSRHFVFCNENTLNHFACEMLVLLEVACGDLSFYKISLVVLNIFTLLPSPVLIVVSYICIIISILKIHSSSGRSKAFSTCSSHLTVVSMFYGTILTTYMAPGNTSLAHLKYIALIYTVLTPLLNPMIYSLRNNEVKEAFQRFLFAGSHQVEHTGPTRY